MEMEVGGGGMGGGSAVNNKVTKFTFMSYFSLDIRTLKPF